MAKQLVPDTAQFRMIHTWSDPGGTQAVVLNSLYVRNTLEPWTGTTLGAMANTIGDAWAAQMMTNLSDNLTFNGIEANDLGADPGDSTVTLFEIAGSDSGDPCSSALAALVRLHGQSGILPKKGHLFIAGIPESQISGNTLTGGFATALREAMEGVSDEVEGGGNALVIVSRFQGGAERAEGVTNIVAEFSVPLMVSTQRDRRT